ncbi:MAG: YchJ family protein [Acidobacteriota bacterium]
MAGEPCPCGGGRTYAACCQPAHLGVRPAPTAEALMRSRYSAYALGRFEYLVKTRHPGERSLADLTALRRDAGAVRWTGLRVLDAVDGGPTDDVGVVEFVAFCEESGRLGELHERSRFRRDGNRWRYVDAEPRPRRPKPGRRDPCWCGSGRKYRRCHGA